MNPIDHLWKILDDSIRKRTIFNKDELKRALQVEWDRIPPTVSANVVHSMPQRLKSVFESKGDPTTYFYMFAIFGLFHLCFQVLPAKLNDT